MRAAARRRENPSRPPFQARETSGTRPGRWQARATTSRRFWKPPATGSKRYGQPARCAAFSPASLPSGFNETSVPTKRKAQFINLVLPLVLHVNETLSALRERVIDMRDREAGGSPLSGEERSWLESVAERYGVERVDYGELLKAVDIIPPSLAIAQSAEESGWGTSRFARAGNALFGQRTYKPGARDMVPEKRADGATFRVRSYNNLLNSVFSYAHNLNSHEAYGAFRDARAQLRRVGRRIDGEALVGTLSRYSERGEAYIETIRRIMRTNELGLFDRARFVDGDGRA